MLPSSPDGDLPAVLERLPDSQRVGAATAELVLNDIRFVAHMGITCTSIGKTAYGQLRREFAALAIPIRAGANSAAVRTATHSDKEVHHDGSPAQADLVR